MNIVNLIAIVSAAIALFNVAIDESRSNLIRRISAAGAAYLWAGLLVCSVATVAVFIYHLIAH